MSQDNQSLVSTNSLLINSQFIVPGTPRKKKQDSPRSPFNKKKEGHEIDYKIIDSHCLETLNFRTSTDIDLFLEYPPYKRATILCAKPTIANTI